MRVIVCTKQVKYTYARTGFDPDSNYIAPEDNIFRINPWDESALDIALELKEKDSSVKVILLTLGPVISEKELRRCLALGADEVYRIDTQEEHDSWSKSILLARGIESLEGDLVFCGRESVDGQNGQAGAFIASHLDFPLVSDVIQIEGDLNAAYVKVLRNAGKGVKEQVECPVPAVFTIARAYRETRLPAYGAKRKAMTDPIRILDVNEDNAKRKLVCRGVFPPRPRPKKVPAPDSNMPAFNRINQLLSGSNAEKKGTVLTGDAETQAEGIISFLIEKGFIKTEIREQDKKA